MITLGLSACMISTQNKRLVIFERGLNKKQETKLRLDDQDFEYNYQDFIKEKNLFLFNHIFWNSPESRQSNIV